MFTFTETPRLSHWVPGELKNLFAGLLKSAELQAINPRPQEQTVHIRQCGLVHTLEYKPETHRLALHGLSQKLGSQLFFF